VSLVTKERWEVFMGDMPMPEGCTSEQMWAMFDVVQKFNYREYAVEQINWYEKLWRNTLPKYKASELQAELDEESANRLKECKKTMALIKEGILFWKGELTE
jgi:hypothetical protein